MLLQTYFRKGEWQTGFDRDTDLLWNVNYIAGKLFTYIKLSHNLLTLTLAGNLCTIDAFFNTTTLPFYFAWPMAVG